MTTAEANTEKARYKTRIHKDFIKKMFDTNVPAILRHLDTMTSRKKYLTEINAELSGLTLNIKADSFSPESSDIVFDDENIILSVQGLTYEGNGFITDSETNVKEKIVFKSDLEPL
jgi:hypothetical protein